MSWVRALDFGRSKHCRQPDTSYAGVKEKQADIAESHIWKFAYGPKCDRSAERHSRGPTERTSAANACRNYSGSASALKHFDYWRDRNGQDTNGPPNSPTVSARQW